MKYKANNYLLFLLCSTLSISVLTIGSEHIIQEVFSQEIKKFEDKNNSRKTIPPIQISEKIQTIENQYLKTITVESLSTNHTKRVMKQQKSFDASVLSPSFQVLEFSFDNPVTLSNGDSIVIWHDGGDNSNKVVIASSAAGIPDAGITATRHYGGWLDGIYEPSMAMDSQGS